MSTPTDIIYLKQQRAEQRQLEAEPEKQDYSIEEVRKMSKEDKMAAIKDKKISSTTCKMLLGHADWSESELRTIQQSPD